MQQRDAHSTEEQKTVLVCGGGFAGLVAVRTLARRYHTERLRITVLDASVFHTYHGWLPEVATYTADHDVTQEALQNAACIPTEILEDTLPTDAMRFLHEKITAVDFATKTVRTESGRTYTANVLIYALGSVTDDHGIPGIAAHALPLHSITQALTIQKKLQELFRIVQLGTQDGRVVICNGGHLGVELATALAVNIRHAEQRHMLPAGRMRIEILDAQPEVLQMLSKNVRRIATARLTKLGVVLRLTHGITNVTHERIALDDGSQHRYDMLLWAGGTKAAASRIDASSTSHDEHGRILVDDTLMLTEYPGVFVCGDSAASLRADAMHPMPLNAQIARQHGLTVATNVMRFLQHRPLLHGKVQRPRHIIALGGCNAVVTSPGTTFSGFVGYCIRRYYDLRYFASILPFSDAVRVYLRGRRLFQKSD